MEKVVVVIPAYNEATVIRGVVEGVRALGYDVLVVDDGSTDMTAYAAHLGGARVDYYYHNEGVGLALMKGVKSAAEMGADIIVTFDADGQHDPRDIAPLIAALADCDLANGSRFLGSVRGMPWHRRVVLWGARIVMSLLCGQRVTDPCCGLKAFRPAAFKIRSHRMAWAAELCWRNRGRIREVPVSVRYTNYSLAKGQRSRDALKVGVELLGVLKEGN